MMMLIWRSCKLNGPTMIRERYIYFYFLKFSFRPPVSCDKNGEEYPIQVEAEDASRETDSLRRKGAVTSSKYFCI